MDNHDRTFPAPDRYGPHIEGDDLCHGTGCPDCGCCMHCNEDTRFCPDPNCGCSL